MIIFPTLIQFNQINFKSLELLLKLSLFHSLINSIFSLLKIQTHSSIFIDNFYKSL